MSWTKAFRKALKENAGKDFEKQYGKVTAIQKLNYALFFVAGRKYQLEQDFKKVRC